MSKHDESANQSSNLHHENIRRRRLSSVAAAIKRADAEEAKPKKRAKRAIVTQVPVLHLNTFFRLPAGFKGDTTDALEELVKYRRAHAKRPRRETATVSSSVRHTKAQRTAYAQAWSDFLSGVCAGFRHVGVGFVETVPFKGRQWARVLNPAKKQKRR